MARIKKMREDISTEDADSEVAPVEQFREDAVCPKRATSESEGIDLVAVNDVETGPLSMFLIPTGFRMRTP